MLHPRYNATPERTLRFRLMLLAVVLALFICVGLVSVAAAFGQLQAVALLLPATLSGLFTVIVLTRWPRRGGGWLRRWLVVILLAIFLGGSYYAFHALWKFVQPGLLPKQTAVIGQPWRPEGSIFTNYNYDDPALIQLDNEYYRMFFDDGGEIKSALSNDGTTFSYEGVRLAGRMPAVIRLADGRWRMYYANAVGDTAASSDIVSAISDDGLNFKPEPGVRLKASAGGLDDAGLANPSVVRLADGSYRLYYDGLTDDDFPYPLVAQHSKILSASSKDGLEWKKDSGYRVDEQPLHTWQAYSPDANVSGGQVMLRFTTPNGIYQATSKDGLDFTIGDRPILAPAHVPLLAAGDSEGFYRNSLTVITASGQRIYYWVGGQGIYSAFQKK